MKIGNFEYSINYKIMDRGRRYFSGKKIIEFSYEGGGHYSAKVSGTNDYNVSVDLKTDGEITQYSCDCPYEQICKHIAAVLIRISRSFEEDMSEKSSRKVSLLIDRYNKNISSEAMTEIAPEAKVSIIPHFGITRKYLTCELVIGREKTYIVNNISELAFDFEYHHEKKYGKAFTFVHNFDNLDERSKALLDIVLPLSKSYDNCVSRRQIILKGRWMRKVLSLYSGEAVMVNDDKMLICADDPKLKFVIKEASNSRFTLNVKNKNRFSVCGDDECACWLDKNKNTLYLASSDFSKNVGDIFSECTDSKKLYISSEDMPSFYSAVLKTVERHCEIEGTELISELVPPDGSAQLYLDVNSDGNIVGRLEYLYGDKVIRGFDSKKGRFCDYSLEYICEKAIKDYFEVYPDADRQLLIVDEDKMYELLSGGLSMLMELMEVFASERFNRMNIRPPVRPVIGIRPQRNLLELDISAENYDTEELIALLGAYRRGAKYHRLRDGSFAVIDSGMSQLSEIAGGLNLTDKALLKEKIHIPAYRMLYLDNLASDNDGVRIKRSSTFKQMVNEFKSMIDDADSAAVPESLENVMRDYQKYGFRWLRTISGCKFGGVLADDMGLGKTIQAISLMLDINNQSDEKKTHLVICPSSLTLNWEAEIKKFAPMLNTAVINGIASERKKLIEKISEYDVAITSYSLIARDIAEYEDKHFCIQIIDEAQYIKNHSTQASKAVKGISSEIRFALTGTPVENSLAELWSIFDFVMPGYLFGYTYFKKTFETPIVKNNDSSAVAALQRLVSPFILRRLKSEVLTELPEKTETVVYADMEPDQKKLYAANVLSVKNALGEGFRDEQERIKILAMLTRLRQICCDPSLVYENYKGESAKLELCMELIGSCIDSGHKLLLFSQFTSMLDIIASRLSDAGISAYMLTGSTKPKERMRLVNAFNKDDTQVFLISLKAGGTGLNLTGADIVIHYDPWWNVSAENQASDRVYRIGQKNSVQIYKLITRETIEEKICELQQEKKELADIAVGGEGNIMHMSSEDILSMLE